MFVAPLEAPVNGKYITHEGDEFVKMVRGIEEISGVPSPNVDSLTFPNTQDSGWNHELTGYCLTGKDTFVESIGDIETEINEDGG